MKTLKLMTLTLGLLVLAGTTAKAQFSLPKPLKNTPFDPKTHVPNVRFGKGSQNHSSLQAYTPPSMDVNGRVWSGSSTTSGGKGRLVRNASRIAYDRNGKAYYVSNYSNAYGKVRPTQRRAPGFDKRKSYPSTQAQRVTWGTAKINVHNGNVTKDKFVNGRKVGTYKVGQAQLAYHNGRPYYSSNGQSVWKAAAGAETILTTTDSQGNTVYRPGVQIAGMDGNKFKQLNDKQKLAAGIVHILGELAKDK